MNNQYRPDWHEYFMGVAEWTAERATCQRLKVGAAIVCDGRLVSTGYNGSSKNEDHCSDVGCYEVNGHCLRAIHAEMNAISNCAKQGVKLENGTLYVTHYPCIRCMPLVIQSGINEIYYIEDYHNNEFSQHLADVANVKIIKMNSSLDKIYKA